MHRDKMLRNKGKVVRCRVPGHGAECEVTHDIQSTPFTRAQEREEVLKEISDGVNEISKANAPFTADQVKNLNIRQSDINLHPYTCTGCEPCRILHATKDGLICSFCGHKQGWVHAIDTV